ncbi:MAG: DUF763 domain-containing protein [Treponema sp.]|nr:DUF763 domain-containing protein [Treponema sp.]
MLRNSGHADLPLHTGVVPKWLADRMMVTGTLIIESIIRNYGVDEALTRLSDPLWFQSFGAVMGMDWHSSGITTSVMYALKRGLNPRAEELGLYVCGGRGRYSRQTPDELLEYGERTGINGDEFVRDSNLVAKIDNNAVQDGFQLYQHNFILSNTGNWAVVQQGMNGTTRTARRYHWCSSDLRSFIEEPHKGVVGNNQGLILNLTDKGADKTRGSILELSCEDPERILKEIGVMAKPENEIILLSGGKSVPIKKKSALAPIPGQGELFPELASMPPTEVEKIPGPGDKMVVVQNKGRNIVMPAHHEVLAQDVDLKRLGGVLATAYETQPKDFESLMLTPGLGPRTLQSLTLVSEVIYGTPSRFTDPARFSFAHGGKDGHPFPVPLKVYDESIRVLQDSIEKSKLGYNEKSDCLRRLHNTAMYVEQNCQPEVDFEKAILYEKGMSDTWDGRTC